MKKEMLDEFKNRVKQVVKGLALDRGKNKISVVKEYDTVFTILANTDDRLTDKQIHNNITQLYCSLGIIIKTMNNEEIGEFARVKMIEILDQYKLKMEKSAKNVDISKDLERFFNAFNKTLVTGFEHQRELKRAVRKLVDYFGEDEHVIDSFFEKLLENISSYVINPEVPEDYRKIFFIARLVDSYEDKTSEMLKIETYLVNEILKSFKKLVGKYSPLELIKYIASINKMLPGSIEKRVERSLPDSWKTALKREIPVKITELIREKVGDVNVNGVLIKNKSNKTGKNDVIVILEKIYNDRISLGDLLQILGSSSGTVTNQVLDYLEESDRSVVKEVLLKRENAKVLKKGDK